MSYIHDERTLQLDKVGLGGEREGGMGSGRSGEDKRTVRRWESRV